MLKWLNTGHSELDKMLFMWDSFVVKLFVHIAAGTFRITDMVHILCQGTVLL
jgi:hypothetical protein